MWNFKAFLLVVSELQAYECTVTWISIDPEISSQEQMPMLWFIRLRSWHNLLKCNGWVQQRFSLWSFRVLLWAIWELQVQILVIWFFRLRLLHDFLRYKKMKGFVKLQIISASSLRNASMWMRGNMNSDCSFNWTSSTDFSHVVLSLEIIAWFS